MKESDQLATSFITPFGMYCYVTMFFGLRNARATYQRCMLHVFGERIGSTVEAYVDDIVVKLKKRGDLIQDVAIAFSCLRTNKIKLNPEKCVFDVPQGMLLGYIVSQRGIEANPEKVSAVARMGPIRDVKGVQKVKGCLAALSRFISRLGEKALPLYRLLKKADRFSWTPEAEKALDNLKKTLTTAPVLVPPQPAEPLLLYVAATTQVVSAAVVVKRPEEGHALPVQRPVYFISEVLSETKVRYPEVDLCRDSRPTQAAALLPRPPNHGGLVLPPGRDYPESRGHWQDRQMVGRAHGRNPHLWPRKAIKSQALADFIAEWTDTQLPPAQVQAELWTMYFDGSLMKTGAGAGLLFISPLDVHIRYVIRIHFTASKNVAEYEALIDGLKIAIELGVRRLDVRGDSQLVIDQVMKASSCHDPKMEAYCKEVRRLEDKFHDLELVHVA